MSVVVPRLEMTVDFRGAESAGVKAAARATLVGMGQWQRSDAGMGVRFTERAFGLYGYTRRSPEYEHKHPVPYVGKGRFRAGLLSGTGARQEATIGSETFTVQMIAKSAAALNFKRAGGLYAAEWARLHQPEAVAIDGAAQRQLDQIGGIRG